MLTKLPASVMPWPGAYSLFPWRQMVPIDPRESDAQARYPSRLLLLDALGHRAPHTGLSNRGGAVGPGPPGQGNHHRPDRQGHCRRPLSARRAHHHVRLPCEIKAEQPTVHGRCAGESSPRNGIHSRTVVPAPGADHNRAWPPCAAAMACTIDRPSPLPAASAASGRCPFEP